MSHDHHSWIAEGKSCHVCSFYLDGSVGRKLVELQAKIELLGNVCEICNTSSFAICDSNHPAAKRINEKWVYCRYCWLSKGAK